MKKAYLVEFCIVQRMEAVVSGRIDASTHNGSIALKVPVGPDRRITSVQEISDQDVCAADNRSSE